MARSARKQREIDAREDLIIGATRKLFAARGYQGFSMDEVARAVEYAKGTLYLHFVSKEDLAVAVATYNLRHRADLLEKATAFTGNSREKLAACAAADSLFVAANPDHHDWEHFLRQPSFWDRASEKRRADHLKETLRGMGVLEGIARLAVEEGNLKLAAGRQINDVVFAVVAAALGGIFAGSVPTLRTYSSLTVSAASASQLDLVLDGLGWKPLGLSVSKKELIKRIRREVFPDLSLE